MSELHTSWEDVLSRRVGRMLWIRDAAEVLALVWSGRQVFNIRKRSVALFLGATILLHLLLVWFLLRSAVIPAATPPIATGVLNVSIVSAPSAQPVPTPAMQTPAAAPAAAPHMDISAPPPSGGSSPDGTLQTLAPRPDPQHVNVPPSIPNVSKDMQVVLHILVGPSGNVDDAQVVRSSGRSEIDATVAAFVKAQWKFLPAMEGGGAVPFWTTVLVRLS